MNDFIENKVNEWSLVDEEIREVNHKINYLEKRLFRNYIPCKSHDSDFFIRLKKWIGNITDDKDQKTMFELVPTLFYISDEEINSLYRSAYNIEVAKWLIDILPINFIDPDNETRLKHAVEETWFCPITDSFSINDFIKINNIPSKYNLRSDWHSLAVLGDSASIKKYCMNQGIKRLVLLEDFVGSGSQVGSRIEFACKCLPDVEILCISLITCPIGVTYLDSLMSRYKRLRVSHIIKIPEDFLINDIAKAGESKRHKDTRDLAKKSYLNVTNGIPPGVKPYHPLGYKKTGALIVLNTNVPDNTLPLVHNQSDTWFPLFKRITRV